MKRVLIRTTYIGTIAVANTCRQTMDSGRDVNVVNDAQSLKNSSDTVRTWGKAAANDNIRTGCNYCWTNSVMNASSISFRTLYLLASLPPATVQLIHVTVNPTLMLVYGSITAKSPSFARNGLAVLYYWNVYGRQQRVPLCHCRKHVSVSYMCM